MFVEAESKEEAQQMAEKIRAKMIEDGSWYGVRKRERTLSASYVKKILKKGE
jgi:hypothetical protein